MKTHKAFTIVELLIVVVVIAILAAITIVAYNGITASAKESALKSDLATAAKKVGLIHAETGTYPAVKPSDLPGYIQYSQTNSGQGFCATASKEGRAFNITQSGTIQAGACSGHTVVGGGGEEGGSTEIVANSPIQNVTPAQCTALPTFTGSNTTAIRTVTDARGGTTRTYEIAKLADGKCWMLTNLKLGSTTGAITLTPADTETASNFTLPQLITGGDPEYDLPRVYGPIPGDTGSGATNYGYLYNWPAVTAGATSATNPAGSGNAPNSICPANWRLPSAGVPGSDFAQLDIAFGGTGALAESAEPNILLWNYDGPFKGRLSGGWGGGDFGDQGADGYLWSASAQMNDSVYANTSGFSSGYFYSDGDGYRGDGFAVRCLLN